MIKGSRRRETPYLLPFRFKKNWRLYEFKEEKKQDGAWSD